MKKKWIFLAVLLLGFTLLASSQASAQTSGYELHWWTVDSGGGHLSGDGYTLNGAIGQPDAGRLTGGDYTLSSGYWSGGIVQIAQQFWNYLPLVTR